MIFGRVKCLFQVSSEFWGFCETLCLSILQPVDFLYEARQVKIFTKKVKEQRKNIHSSTYVYYFDLIALLFLIVTLLACHHGAPSSN